MKRNLEEMATEELLRYFFSLYHQLEPVPKSFNVSAKGIILLDPNNAEDRTWYEGE